MPGRERPGPGQFHVYTCRRRQHDRGGCQVPSTRSNTGERRAGHRSGRTLARPWPHGRRAGAGHTVMTTADIWLTAAARAALEKLPRAQAVIVNSVIRDIPRKPGRRLNIPGGPPACRRRSSRLPTTARTYPDPLDRQLRAAMPVPLLDPQGQGSMEPPLLPSRDRRKKP